MPNPIKYSASPQTLALKKGNFWIGTGDSDKGPTSTTGYWNGITPVTGGYSVYINRPSGMPSVYNPASDSELITVTRNISGTTFATGPSALNWYNSQTDYMCLNIDYPQIVSNGISVNVDAGFTPSFPRGGTSWYDVGPSGNNSTMYNGPVWSSTSGGIFTFDGVDDFGVFENYYPLYSGDFAINFWVNFTVYKIYQNVISSVNDGNATLGFWVEFGTTRGFTLYSTGSTLVLEDNVVSLTSLSTGVWYNVCISRVGTGTNNIKLFVNNILCGQNTSNVSIGSASRRLEIARYATGTFDLIFDGKISNIQIYGSRGLSSTEVLQNYQALFPRFLGANIISLGLVLYLDAGYTLSYPGSGTAWNDVSGFSNNSTLTNGPTYSSADGGSIVFDGTNDYASVGNPSSLQLTTNFTVAAWVKRDTIQSSWPAIVAKGDSSYRISASSDGTRFHFAVNTTAGTTFFDVGTFSINTWYYMVLTYSTSSLIGYVNGSELGRNNFGSPLTVLTNSFEVGIGYNSQQAGRNWDGNIAVVQIYNRTLSAEEVLQNYNAQKGRFGL